MDGTRFVYIVNATGSVQSNGTGTAVIQSVFDLFACDHPEEDDADTTYWYRGRALELARDNRPRPTRVLTNRWVRKPVSVVRPWLRRRESRRRRSTRP